MVQAPGIGGKGGMVIGILWGENILSAIVIGFRLYTRKFIKGSIGSDDYCLLVTWSLMVVFASLTTVSCINGMGQHFDDLTTQQFSHAMLWEVCAQCVVSQAIGMGKVVVAVFLLRIVAAPWQKWFLWFCITSMMILSIILSICLFIQCTPTQAIWDPALAAERVCSVNLTIVAFVDCAWAAVMDFTLAIFPWIALRKLNMKRKERILICLSLSLGVIAGVCGIIRTSGLEALSNSTDYLYATSDSVIWTASEVTITMICVTFPALRPLYHQLMGHTANGSGYEQHDDSDYKGSNKSYRMKYFPSMSKDPKLTFDESTTVDIEAGKDDGVRQTDSDENVLLNNDGHILRVQEVSVTYDGKGRAKVKGSH